MPDRDASSEKNGDSLANKSAGDLAAVTASWSPERWLMVLTADLLANYASDLSEPASEQLRQGLSNDPFGSQLLEWPREDLAALVSYKESVSESSED